MREGRIEASSRVLEIGSGTGNYVRALNAATGASCWGVDPSAGMLDVARRRAAEVRFVQGAAEALPFAEAQFDFAFSVDVIHHVSDAAAYFVEAFRVLAPRRTLTTVTDDSETVRGRVHAHYFPEVIGVELARYPSLRSLRTAMRAAGFEDVRVSDPESAYQISDSAAYAERAFSSLHLIPEAAFVHGLRRLDADLQRGPIQAVTRRVLLSGVKGT